MCTPWLKSAEFWIRSTCRCALPTWYPPKCITNGEAFRVRPGSATKSRRSSVSFGFGRGGGGRKSTKPCGTRPWEGGSVSQRPLCLSTRCLLPPLGEGGRGGETWEVTPRPMAEEGPCVPSL